MTVSPMTVRHATERIERAQISPITSPRRRRDGEVNGDVVVFDDHVMGRLKSVLRAGELTAPYGQNRRFLVK